MATERPFPFIFVTAVSNLRSLSNHLASVSNDLEFSSPTFESMSPKFEYWEMLSDRKKTASEFWPKARANFAHSRCICITSTGFAEAIDASFKLSISGSRIDFLLQFRSWEIFTGFPSKDICFTKSLWARLKLWCFLANCAVASCSEISSLFRLFWCFPTEDAT